MVKRIYTDEEIRVLRETPKRVTNPKARWLKKPKDRPGHFQRTYIAVSDEDEKNRFQIYQRKNLVDGKDFSCGISFLPPGSGSLTLARYNGGGHRHGDIVYHPHVHQTTERAMAMGRKPEFEATKTDQFHTLEGALACLIEDFNLSGLKAEKDQPELL